MISTNLDVIREMSIATLELAGGTAKNEDVEMIPTQVHFVGSIGLDSVREVFQTLGSELGTRLRRIPDGEPGGRRACIG